MNDRRRWLQCEIDIYSSGHIERMPIDRVGLISPLTHSINRGAPQGLGPFHYVQSCDCAFFGDCSLHSYNSLDVVPASELGIVRSGRRKQIAFHYVCWNILDIGIDWSEVNAW